MEETLVALVEPNSEMAWPRLGWFSIEPMGVCIEKDRFLEEGCSSISCN